jgi:hypothetical protein
LQNSRIVKKVKVPPILGKGPLAWGTHNPTCNQLALKVVANEGVVLIVQKIHPTIGSLSFDLNACSG